MRVYAAGGLATKAERGNKGWLVRSSSMDQGARDHIGKIVMAMRSWPMIHAIAPSRTDASFKRG